MNRTFTVIVAAALAAACSSGREAGEEGESPPLPPPPPTVQLSIGSAALDEGNTGSTELVFAVTLSAAAASEVSVAYATSDASATVDQDYAATSGRLQIAPGATNAQISVPVRGDTGAEDDETFLLTLSDPSANAALAVASATGTIRNDDISGPAPVLGAHLNDTGVTGCSNGVANALVCDDASVGTDRYPRQDAQAGRDRDRANSSDGAAGFSFTKLDAQGAPLLDQSVPYATTPWDCVRDNVTGLVWEVKTDDGTARDQDWTYSWYDSSGRQRPSQFGQPGAGDCVLQDACDTEKYAAAANESQLCGFEDWRLPTRSELLSIVHFGATSAPLIDAAYFANTPSRRFWTASNATIGGAWWVDASSGNSGTHYWGEKYGVRLVRGSGRR